MAEEKKKPERRSLYSNKVKSINDLLRDRELVAKFNHIFQYGYDIERKHWYIIPTDERNDEFVALLIDLGLVQYDWAELKKQTHRNVGNRTIEFSCFGDQIRDIFDRLDCKNSIIRKQTLEHIARHPGELDSGSQLADLLISWGASKTLIEYPNTKWRMIFLVLCYYATSPEKKDREMLFKIIEEVAHPLMYGGDKEKALEVQDNFSSYLEYDGYCFVNGKITKTNSELIKAIEDRKKERKGGKLFDTVGGGLQKPIPIQIVGGQIRGEMKIDGLEKGLEAIAKAKKGDNRPKFPYKLPAGTRWENFTIKFLDDENVFIQVKQFKHNANYKDMGFIGKGNNPNPSEAWTFLKVLAGLNGELTTRDLKARDKYKKQKELLAKSLQGYFLLEYDPFYPYRSSSEKNGNSYKIKITLIPPPADIKKLDTEEEKDDLGIKEYYNEQALQVYEDE